MTKVESIADVVRRGLCVSCGACVSEAPDGAMRMALDPKGRVYHPVIDAPEPVTGRGPEFEVCPGAGLPVDRLSAELFGADLPTDARLGRFRRAVAARCVDEDILRRASSGGTMTGIALHLMERGRVDGATVAEMVYDQPGGPKSTVRLATTPEQLRRGQGSKYCPTSMNLLVRESLRRGGRYLFIGTPCQVGSLRLAQRLHPGLRETFPLTMANFCGGFRDFRFTDWLIRKNGLDPKAVEYFQYRGSGQPGRMVARTADGHEACEPYPDYMQYCPVPKLRRCVYCIDGTGLLADFACGDAWLERFEKDEHPWSILLARSQWAEEVVHEMAGADKLILGEVSAADVVESQQSNLTSKIDRQYKRMRLARLFGSVLPAWDVDLPRDASSYYWELRTLLLKFLSRSKTLRRVKRELRGR
ncbi:MAG: Coenzyme F420 hydrogenase/dehydrogenase, beta subunit C-terminal domain [Planctomycetota bacterium]|jgi:coenzyme F420 hydrogenase subunit beta